MSNNDCIKLAAQLRDSIEKDVSFSLPMMKMKDFSRLLEMLKN